MIRVLITILVAALYFGTTAAAPVSPEVREQFEQRLASLKLQAVEQVKSLSATAETLPADKSDAIQLKIIELKKATEIERLQILLEWAQVEQDQERIAEIEQALGQLQTPESTAKLPEIPAQKLLAPGTEQPNSSAR